MPKHPAPPSPVEPSARRRRLPDREETVPVSLFLTRPLWRRLRELALDLNWTQGEILRQAFTEWLTAHAAELPGERQQDAPPIPAPKPPARKETRR